MCWWGCWTDVDHDTGITVVLPPSGSLGACWSGRRARHQGGGRAERGRPGGRVPRHRPVRHSVFGLAAVDGVVNWCVEKGRGLGCRWRRCRLSGPPSLRHHRPRRPPPDRRRRPEGLRGGLGGRPADGSVGVGRGCSIGKLSGRHHASKGGQRPGGGVGRRRPGRPRSWPSTPSATSSPRTHRARRRARRRVPRYPSTPIDQLRAWGEQQEARGNTTIGCLVTNARLTKPEASGPSTSPTPASHGPSTRPTPWSTATPCSCCAAAPSRRRATSSPTSARGRSGGGAGGGARRRGHARPAPRSPAGPVTGMGR